MEPWKSEQCRERWPLAVIPLARSHLQPHSSHETNLQRHSRWYSKDPSPFQDLGQGIAFVVLACLRDTTHTGAGRTRLEPGERTVWYGHSCDHLPSSGACSRADVFYLYLVHLVGWVYMRISCELRTSVTESEGIWYLYTVFISHHYPKIPWFH